MKKDRHPAKRQVQRVIDNLSKALKLSKDIEKEYKHSVDMGEGCIIVDTVNKFLEPEINVCGTPLCHGGWYLLVALSKKQLKTELKSKQAPEALYVDFTDGAEHMAKHLGFKGVSELEEWAGNNPKIWGNESGQLMFCGNSAFNYKNELTLSKIITHWKRVQKRLPK